MSEARSSDPIERALAATEVFCETRSPDEFRDEVRVTCSRRGQAITIVEERPPWKSDTLGPDWTKLKVAQLRYDPKWGTWSLHCCDRNERWWSYPETSPSASVDPLLAEIDRDPTGIFWG